MNRLRLLPSIQHFFYPQQTSAGVNTNCQGHSPAIRRCPSCQREWTLPTARRLSGLMKGGPELHLTRHREGIRKFSPPSARVIAPPLSPKPTCIFRPHYVGFNKKRWEEGYNNGRRHNYFDRFISLVKKKLGSLICLVGCDKAPSCR